MHFPKSKVTTDHPIHNYQAPVLFTPLPFSPILPACPDKDVGAQG